MTNNKVINLGQVFTKSDNVEQILHLMKNKGKTLEPSCGNGAIFNRLITETKSLGLLQENIFGIELDESIVTSPKILIGDFFKIIDKEFKNIKFDSIVGNPPYVKYQNISPDTKENLDMLEFDERTNLYIFFIKKCIEKLNNKGELIFLVPRDFLKASSARKMNQWLYETGTITNIVDFGDLNIFDQFSPNCIIFRFEKGNFDRKIIIQKYTKGIVKEKESLLQCISGQLLYTTQVLNINASDIFEVKVGAVSGADTIFKNKKGNIEIVNSKTFNNNKTKRVFYNIDHPELRKFKSELLKRKIRQFTEKNWFLWGRNFFQSERPRIYVNAKTRYKNPFFIHDCKAYDGSILAIFPKFEMNNEELCNLKNDLNNLDWEELGFLCENRFLFSQSALENIQLPEVFRKYIKQ